MTFFTRIPASGYWIALLALLCLLRVEHRFHFRNLYIDTEVQMAAAVQAHEGNGYCLPRADLQNPDHIAYEPVSVFMPGLMRLFSWSLGMGLGPYGGIFFWEILAIVGWVVASATILQRLLGQKKSSFPWAFGIFLGIALPPLHYLTTSGLLALSLWTCALALSMIGNLKNRWRPFLMLLLLGIAAWVRTAYLPLLALPLVFSLAGGRFRERGPELGGLFLASIGVGTLLVLTSTALSSYNESIPLGFFPEHLAYMEPFGVKAFLYWGLPHQIQVADLVGQNWAFIQAGLNLLSWGIIGLLIYGSWKNRENSSYWTIFRFYLLPSCIIVLGTLMYQSLRTPPEDWNWIGFWTFVMEPRYFASIMTCLIIAAFFLYQAKPFWGQKLLRAWIGGILLLNVAFYLFVRWDIYTGKNAMTPFNLPQKQAQLVFVDSLRQNSSLPIFWVKGNGGLAPTMAGVPYVEADSLAALHEKRVSCYLLTYEVDSTGLENLSSFSSVQVYLGMHLYKSDSILGD